jgi:cellulose synthase/poly-beta-1,6-N-acetylglucosamine synthase-like glycosyltransferase
MVEMWPLWLCCGIYGLLVGYWWYGHLTILRIQRGELQVSPAAGPPPGDLPSLAVIIAAKDEAEHIEGCLQSVIEQAYPGLQIVVVNDRSTDATPAILDRLAGQTPNLSIIHVADRPEDWSGKTYALSTGSEDVQADYLLFLDADCRLRPGGLVGAVQYAQAHQTDLLSLWPGLQLETFWERLLIPQAGMALAACFDLPGLSTSRWRPPFADGQFILFRAEAYRQIGGHESVRHHLIEDIPIARRARDHGLRVFAAYGRNVLSVRMYESFGQIYRGWSRIYVGALASVPRLVELLLFILLNLLPFALVPALAAFLIARPGSESAAPAAALLVLAVLHLAASYSGLGWAHRMVGAPTWPLIWLPLGIPVLVVAAAEALLVTAGLKKLVWRNTPYRILGGKLRPIGTKA